MRYYKKFRFTGCDRGMVAPALIKRENYHE